MSAFNEPSLFDAKYNTQSTKRVKKLTPKAMEQYEQKLSDYVSKLQSLKSLVSETIDNNSSISENTRFSVLEELCFKLDDQVHRYNTLHTDMMAFLSRTCTAESNIESSYQAEAFKIFKVKVDGFQQKAHAFRYVRMFDNKSERSHSSRGSRSSKSNTNYMIAMKQAEAEAAKVKLLYLEKEADLQRQKFEIEEKQKVAEAALTRQKEELDFQMHLLREKKNAAAITAEAEILEQSLNGSSNSSLRDIPKSDPHARTAEFVNKLAMPCNVETSAPVQNETVLENKDLIFETPPQPRFSDQQRQGVDIANDLTRFLLRKDLSMSRLSRFNDKPENYQCWKASFSDVTREMGVSAAEEFDLLVKWLGPESQRHAVSLRSAYSKDTSAGLRKIWERLDERFGSPESVHHSVMKRLENFPRLTTKDSPKLYDLADILAEIAALKQDPKYASVLSYFDSSVGVTPIIGRVPFLQEKWARKATEYKRSRDVAFPPFRVLADFISDQAKFRNDPGLPLFTTQGQSEKAESGRKQVFSRKTDLSGTEVKKPMQHTKENLPHRCPIHNTEHNLDSCRTFKTKSFEEKRNFLKTNNLCFKCLSPAHLARDCTSNVRCNICFSDTHCSSMHARNDRYSGERANGATNVRSSCTEVCGPGFSGKSCAKMVLVNVYNKDHPDNTVKAYAIIDDQSNRTLAKSSLFEMLDLKSSLIEYSLSSCNGRTVSCGRIADGCVVESLNGECSFEISSLLECDEIPSVRDEIPTPNVAKYHPHLNDISSEIPPVDEKAEILILIGRDISDVHHVYDQRTGRPNSPFAQKIGLGWVIVGESCLQRSHGTASVTVNKTHLVCEGRDSLCPPCRSTMYVKERFNKSQNIDHDIFLRTKDDEKVGLSVEDKQFLTMMDKEMYKHPSGNWVAPLPFRFPRKNLPNNKQQAVHRARLLDTSLKKNPEKRAHFVTFMKDVINNGHAEEAPPVKESEECWYLPIFGVYHPKKPDQIRGVFDASARYQGISLNDTLMSGPDLTNSLLGVLVRFRKEAVAVTADIQRMFYCFLVDEKHRNLLRFLWYKDNDPDKELIDYRMCVHVFGNKPSPAVATYGLRKAVEPSADDVGADVGEFVRNNFYVDDGLISLPTPESAVSLMKRTQKTLKKSGLRLHKIASNSETVMQAFPAEDLSKDIQNLVIGSDELPLQHSLGLEWKLASDSFLFHVSEETKPYTKRGVLSTINSIYDPLGLVAPVVVTGKLILRELMSEKTEWDEPLSAEMKNLWEAWRDSLQALGQLEIPRPYFPVTMKDTRRELLIFSDASEKAIAAAVYITGQTEDGNWYKSLVLGKAKVAPKSGHTIPRLELCAGVLAVELYEVVTDHLHEDVSRATFYTDSKVVLGYIQNESRRFYTYVSNRVERIRRSSKPTQWKYINTGNNPVDCATRPIQAHEFLKSSWLNGPEKLPKDASNIFPLVEPDEDEEIRPSVNTLSTNVGFKQGLGSKRFERFSTWTKLVKAVALLRHICLSFRYDSLCNGWHHKCAETKRPKNLESAQQFILCSIQEEYFREEIRGLSGVGHVPKESSLASLDPFIDGTGLLRVGGRLNKSSIPQVEKNPIIVPKNSHVAVLIARHFHEKVQHQGRHLTEGSIRAEGYWIVGCKGTVASVIRNCVKCKRLRGSRECQKMADLPTARLNPSPPFSFVGVDTFGPWEVSARKTRGGHANSKRWALLFTCLSIRAIHIEVIESLSASCFINAFRRFIAIRGDVQEVYSDCGTNFVGAAKEMGVDSINVEDTLVKQFLTEKRITWYFNPPHASHMGGAWERMIGVSRRILDSMLLNIHQTLTHEILTTLMAEVSAIINARPLVPVSTDPSRPEILTPATLLTLKTSRPLELEYLPVDMKTQWKQVQALADGFWKRWRVEYIQTLQSRRKWKCEQANLKVGDIVLMRDKEAHRNAWPMGMVVTVFPGEDDRVRKVEVKTTREGKTSTYIRPVTELVLLLS